MRLSLTLTLAATFTLLGAVPAKAQDEDLEVWFNPSVTRSLDDRTAVELETTQRFRESPRDDTWFARLWLKRKDPAGRTWSAGLEQRWNGSDEREVRLLQQVSYGWGPVALRTRMEQRFVNVDPRTGWRVRQRIGTAIPLAEGDEAWALVGDAELFVTIRSTEPDGQTGITGLRTFVGFERSFGRYDLSLGYLRQQDIREAGPDRVGHAPYFGLNVNF